MSLHESGHLRATGTQPVRCPRGRVRGAFAAAVAVVLLLMVPAVGWGAPSSPHWVLLTQAAPTDFHPGDTSDFYEVVAVNDGGVGTTSEPITVTDTLPAGVVVNSISAIAETGGVRNTASEFFNLGCEQAGNEGVVTVTCTTQSGVPSGRAVYVNINVQVPVGAPASLVNSAAIIGGGAPRASEASSTPVTDASRLVPYGASIVGDLTDGSGIATQAGSHPFAVTTLVDWNVGSIGPNEHCNENSTPVCARLAAHAKDVEVALPPGLVGNPTAVPYCPQIVFESTGFYNCPASTQVGGIYLFFYREGTQEQYAPLYNIEPPPGHPAELGFSVSTVAHVPVFFHVRSDGDYGLSTDISNINELTPVRMALVSVWGNPSDEAHHSLRLSTFGNCGTGSGGCPSGVASPKPFLRLPTSCTGGPLSFSIAGDSWQEPLAAPFPVSGTSSVAAMTGCEALRFEPSLTAAVPSTRQAGAPTGYNVDLRVPQNEELEELATPDLHRAEVSFPEGTALSPSAANGLLSCSDAQFGVKVLGAGACPAASRVGSVSVRTPALAVPLTGSLYVGEPECSPCSAGQAQEGKLVRVFFEAEASGVRVKRVGYTRISPTGRLTAVFDEIPEQPVSDIEFTLKGGPNAALVNPSGCGPAVTAARLTPWSTSTPTEVLAPAIPITGCSPAGFQPAFASGMTSSAQAGGFSPFSVSFSRQDGEQALGGLKVTTPPGLLGILKGVERCSEPQAAQGTCGAASLIGHTTATAGPGPDPVSVQGGQVFLTGPYKGAPFGLSVIVPAVAGPFNLGNVIVRAAIQIDPHTAQITVVSDPLPTVLDGIPLQLRSVNVTIDRPGFMFNPTNCDPLTVGGTLTSTQGTTASVSSDFQAVNCATLPFKPVFSVSTQAGTSKKNGASLTVKGTFPTGAQANIRSVGVVLPKQLPARLTTIQQACPEATFNANPASCPVGSNIGVASATTPILSSPLTGPAYLVSHGGAAFPDVVIVFQSEGVTFDLVGSVNIKHGITSSTFATVPDAPISSFELSLPEGPHSGLAAVVPAKAKGNLCGQKLTMPFTTTGQNGAVLKQNTRIQVTGCLKTKTKAKKTIKQHKKGKKQGK